MARKSKKRTITTSYGKTDEGRDIKRTEEAAPRGKIKRLQRQLRNR